MPDDPVNREAAGLSNVDGWTNVLTGLGNSARDKRKSAVFVRDWELDRDTLENLFHGDDMICRVCELPAKEMTREWIEIAGDPEAMIASKLQALNARTRTFEALTWARLYGGCVIVMIVQDGRAMDQPLNIDGVTAIDDLLVIDRHDLHIVRKYADPAKPKFGRPELFEIRTTAITVPGQIAQSFGAKIHESRCLIFEGALTGRRRKIENLGWSQGIVDRIYEVVRDFTAAYAGASVLLQDYSQAVFKIKGLANMLASDEDALVLKRLQLLDLARSICRAVILDADGEEFTREATPTTGMPDLLDRIASRLSAAIDIPLTRLMGTSAAGMNATGEGDLRNWYNSISNEQESQLRAPIALLLSVVAKAVGFVPKDSKDGQVHFEFRSLWQPTEKETVETRKLQAETDVLYHGIGALDTAEIAVSRWGGDKYSIETTIDKGMPELDPANVDPNALDTPSRGAPTADVQATALNGQQVSSGIEVLKAVADGSIALEAAIVFLEVAFPAWDKTKIATMVNAQKTKAEVPKPAPIVNPIGTPAIKQEVPK